VFWGPLLRSLDPAELESVRTVGALIPKERNLHRFLVSREICERYVKPFDRMISEIESGEGTPWVIDSSKNTSRLVALLRSSVHDVKVIHLVRDARGMIESHNRRRAEAQYLSPMLEWTVKNALSSTVTRAQAGSRMRRVVYEQLVADPARTIGEIGAWLDLDLSDVAERAVSGEEFAMPHIFRGNREVRGSVSVALDPSRLLSQRLPEEHADRFWFSGGFVTRLWGYDRAQSYMPRSPDNSAT
jgi:hypothetical protein